jgi:hypothetical protein
MCAGDTMIARTAHPLHIVAARLAAAFDDAGRYVENRLVRHF